MKKQKAEGRGKKSGGKFAQKFRAIVLEAFPPDVPCDSGFLYEDAIVHLCPGPSSGRGDLEKRKRFAKHLVNGCWICAARLGEMREGENGLAGACHPAGDSGSVRKIKEAAKKILPLRRFLDRNWDNLRKQYPGKTVLVWDENGAIKVREYCVGPRSPAEICQETGRRGLRAECLSVFVPLE
jgi:hypothetical protein